MMGQATGPSELRRWILGRCVDWLPSPMEPRVRVFGRVVTPSPVRTPIEGIACALCWTVLVGLTGRGRRVATEVATGHDFLLRMEDRGVVQVRAAGATLLEWMEAEEPLPDFVPRAVPRLQAALDRAGIVRVSHYGELALLEGDPITVRGVLRDELANPATTRSYRGGSRALPTLTGAGGRLEIRYDEVRVAPMRRL